MHEWRNHTAEIELAIEAQTEEDVFAEAAGAFGELVGLDDEGEPLEHLVTIEAADRDALLVQWLEELIFLAETESFVPEAAQDIRLDGTSVHAKVVGRRGRFEPLVKAATYHGLRFDHDEEGVWHARLVLDV